MAEYINKQELLKNFCGYDLTRCKKYGNETPEQQSQSISTLMMYEIAMEIEDAPAADIRPERHGEWKKYKGKRERSFSFICSECNGFLPFTSKFCPRCGAKMDGEDGANNDNSSNNS